MWSAIRTSFRLPVTSATRMLKTSAPVATERFNHKRIPADDEGVAGEKAIDLDNVLRSKQNLFPTADSDNLIFNGIVYKDLPICNIRVSPNNTIFTVTDATGTVKLIRSCGIEGFKNTKKGTNIAAQTTAIAIATKAIDRGFRTVRVRMQGLGPGRLGCTMYGYTVGQDICFSCKIHGKDIAKTCFQLTCKLLIRRQCQRINQSLSSKEEDLASINKKAKQHGKAK